MGKCNVCWRSIDGATLWHSATADDSIFRVHDNDEPRAPEGTIPTGSARRSACLVLDSRVAQEFSISAAVAKVRQLQHPDECSPGTMSALSKDV